ncbi:Protein of unknown function [Cotesia congregata]|uniref:Uncharacterized protein n=1 Tax=Cotesia congregata TaxID=51543 RepID=A0A8J2HRA0_COTCN|nr:Protein of unknown function [Cotesia congregata]
MANWTMWGRSLRSSRPHRSRHEQEVIAELDPSKELQEHIQAKSRGRPSKAEAWSKDRTPSTNSILNYLSPASSKRGSEKDSFTHSPTGHPKKKISRQVLSPTNQGSHPDSSNLNSLTTMESVILKKLDEMSKSSSSQLKLLEKVLTTKIEDSLKETTKEFQILIESLRQENSELKETVGSLEARIKILESSSANCITSPKGTSRSLHDKIASASANAVENKLKPPVYINHDLTPQESLISKKLRDESRRLKLLNKKVKTSNLKITVDGIDYTYDIHLEAIVPLKHSSSQQYTNNASYSKKSA